MPRTAIVLALGLAGCAGAPLHVSSPPPALYADAMAEAVGGYELEVQAVARGQQTAPRHGWRARYDERIEAALRARGLTPEGLGALARREPRFYFTQQALFAERLRRANELASREPHASRTNATSGVKTR